MSGMFDTPDPAPIPLEPEEPEVDEQTLRAEELEAERARKGRAATMLFDDQAPAKATGAPPAGGTSGGAANKLLGM